MDIVRDVLDKSVVDRNGREMGRVDAILIEYGDDAPRVVAILIGPSALGSRLHPVIGRLVHRLERRLGIDRDRPCEIRVEDIGAVDDIVRVKLSAGETSVDAVEQLLRKWIVKLPGSR